MNVLMAEILPLIFSGNAVICKQQITTSIKRKWWGSKKHFGQSKWVVGPGNTFWPANTHSSPSQNTLDPGMAQEYISQVSEEIEGRVTKKLFKEFSRTGSRILGALSKLDEFRLKPQVRTCSVAVPGASRNNGSENREPTWDRSLGDPCPETVFSACHPSNLNDSEQYCEKVLFWQVWILKFHESW